MKSSFATDAEKKFFLDFWFPPVEVITYYQEAQFLLAYHRLASIDVSEVMPISEFSFYFNKFVEQKKSETGDNNSNLQDVGSRFEILKRSGKLGERRNVAEKSNLKRRSEIDRRRRDLIDMERTRRSKDLIQRDE